MTLRILSRIVVSLLLVLFVGFAVVLVITDGEPQILLNRWTASQNSSQSDSPTTIIAQSLSSSSSEPQSSQEESSQPIIETDTNLYSRLADYIPPEGEGQLLEGDLPEDRLPQSETYDFPAEFYPYRAMLTAEEQAAYDQAYGNALQLYDEFPLHTPISVDSLTNVMNALLNDHPGLFWLSNSYQYSYVTQGQVMAVTLFYNETASDIARHRQLFDDAAQAVLEGAQALESAVEQEKYVHDYLLDRVSYVLDSPLNQSAYSALIYGETVCAGYARAFQYLMQQLNIPCYYCTGYAGEPHAWNIIKLNDGYYHVDVAWNDPLGNATGQRHYNYFNITDEQIAGDHTRGELSARLPKCEASAYSYASIFGDNNEGEVGGRAPGQIGALPAPEDIGLNRADAISTLEDYSWYCEDQLVALGEGNHTFTALIANEELLHEIFRVTEDQSELDIYLPAAANRLGLEGYSYRVSLQGEMLTDGFWLLTQQVEFSGQQTEGWAG